MNALVITPNRFLPATNGASIYTNGMIKYLHHLGYKVTVASFYIQNDYTDEDYESAKEYIEKIYSCKLHFSDIRFNFSFKYPNSIRKYTRRNMRKMLLQIMQRKSFDLVVIDHLQMFEYAKLFTNTKVLLHTHNVESNLWHDMLLKEKGIKRSLIHRNYKLIYDYEIRALKTADSVTAISDGDVSLFHKMLDEKKEIPVFHGYNKYEIVKDEANILKNNNTIIFIGSYSWYPNSSAATFLISEVMPLIREKTNDVCLYLIGNHPTNEMIKAAKQYEDIVVTGRVESVDEYIRKGDVFVNAVSEGSGLNIKMVEAMGKGIPIVSSEYGYRGFEVSDGHELLVYRNADECANKIVELLNNRSLALNLRDNARSYYEIFVEPSDEVKKAFL